MGCRVTKARTRIASLRDLQIGQARGCEPGAWYARHPFQVD